MTDIFSTKLATDKEQAQELIKSGILADSCDMYFYSDSNCPQVRYRKTANDFDLDCYEPEHGNLPCWSLTRLIEFLPDCHLSINTKSQINLYQFTGTAIGGEKLSTHWCQEVVDAAVEMVLLMQERKSLRCRFI